MNYSKALYLVLNFLFISTCALASKEVIFITDSLQEVWLNNTKVEYYRDTTTILDLDKIRELKSYDRFQSFDGDLINKDVNAAYWIHFRVVDLRKSDKAFRVEIFDFDTDEISLYTKSVSENYQENSAGYDMPFDRREIKHKNVSFLLNLPQGDTLDCYMRFKSSRLNVLEPVIRSYDKVINYALSEYLFLGVFYGLILLMIFYNLVYFVILRQGFYLYYVTYGIGILLYIMSQNGTGFQYLWPQFPFLNLYANQVGLFVGIQSILLFTVSFFRLKERHKVCYRIVITCLLVRSILFVLDLYWIDPFSWYLVDIVLLQLALAIGILIYKNGQYSAKWFIVAFLILDISFLVTVLEQKDVIQSAFWNVYSLNWGIVLQFAFLSISAAEGVKESYIQTNKAQKELLKFKEVANVELEEKVKIRTHELEEQKAIVEFKNDQIFDSLSYAKNIQNAILPTSEQLNKVFPERLIINKPRDIVSGDFYWLYEINEAECLFAVVDCTGHGVPGAFMSMIGVNILEEIVAELIYAPNKMLELVHSKINYVLKQQENHNEDGMDMALCYINKRDHVLQYSGARIPLVYTINGKTEIIKGNRTSLGGTNELITEDRFSIHTLNFKNNNLRIYLYSDGFKDQFGGEKGKKLYTSGLIKMIEKYKNMELSESKPHLQRFFDEWKGTHDQVDDVLFVGIDLNEI